MSLRSAQPDPTSWDLPPVDAVQLRPEAIVDPSSQGHKKGPAVIASAQQPLSWQHRPSWKKWSIAGIIKMADASIKIVDLTICAKLAE